MERFKKFIQWMGRVYDTACIMRPYDGYTISPYTNATDYDFIKKDWEMVGKDLWSAIEKFEEQEGIPDKKRIGI